MHVSFGLVLFCLVWFLICLRLCFSGDSFLFIQHQINSTNQKTLNYYQRVELMWFKSFNSMNSWCLSIFHSNRNYIEWDNQELVSPIKQQLYHISISIFPFFEFTSLRLFNFNVTQIHTYTHTHIPMNKHRKNSAYANRNW